jgi:hypothetical protein
MRTIIYTCDVKGCKSIVKQKHYDDGIPYGWAGTADLKHYCQKHIDKIPRSRD